MGDRIRLVSVIFLPSCFLLCRELRCLALNEGEHRDFQRIFDRHWRQPVHCVRSHDTWYHYYCEPPRAMLFLTEIECTLSSLEYWEPVHYLIKTVWVYESPKSCRIYTLYGFHCPVPHSSEWINGYRLGGDWKRESFSSPNMWILTFSFDLQPYSLSLLCSVLYQQNRFVLMLFISLVVSLFLVGQYDFFQSCVGTCQWVRYLMVTLVLLAPASNFSWTDLDSETLCRWCHSLKYEQPCLVF